jgi:hypothetical protein
MSDDLPIEFRQALGEWVAASYELIDHWPDVVHVNNGRYPTYLPEFEEFLYDFVRTVEGRTDECDSC